VKTTSMSLELRNQGVPEKPIWQKKGPERKGQNGSHYIPPKIMLDFCQKLITLTVWLENVAWFPASAYLQTGSGLHLFRLSKIPLDEDPACGAMRCGVVLIRLGCNKIRI
jgi:hypothetical protein